jgi:hypothetical protein
MEALQGAPLRACWPRKGANKLATPLGNENLAMMADLSSSNLMALEGLPEDLRKGIHDEILPHCYQVTEQGVIMMNEAVIDELRMYDLPRRTQYERRGKAWWKQGADWHEFYTPTISNCRSS